MGEEIYIRIKNKYVGYRSGNSREDKEKEKLYLTDNKENARVFSLTKQGHLLVMDSKKEMGIGYDSKLQLDNSRLVLTPHPLSWDYRDNYLLCRSSTGGKNLYLATCSEEKHLQLSKHPTEIILEQVSSSANKKSTTPPSKKKTSNTPALSIPALAPIIIIIVIMLLLLAGYYLLR